MEIINTFSPLQRISMPSRRILITAAASLSAILVTSLFFKAVSAQALSPAHHVTGSASDPQKVYLSAAGAAAAAPAATVATPTPTREIHIANNGLALLRGALVTSVSDDSIRVTVPFGGEDFIWVLQTSSGTKFITRDGEEEGLADIQAGDSITATGKLAGGGKEPIVIAQFVHE